MPFFPRAYFRWIFAAGLFITAAGARGQFLPMHYYTTRDGLPSNYVTALLQDSRGFLWVGTSDGLCVFDGVGFRTYTTLDGLPNPYVTGIRESVRHPGTLWICTIADGIARFRDGVLTAFRYPPSTARITTNALAEDRDGSIWCATTAGAFIVDGDSLRLTTLVPREYVSNDDIVAGPDGSLWVALNNRIYVRGPGGGEPRVIDTGLPPNAYILHLSADRNGDIWATASDSSVRLFSGGRMAAVWKDRRYGVALQAMVDSDSILWITSSAGMLCIPRRAFPGGSPRYTRLEYSAPEAFAPLIEDRERTLWYGGWGTGLGKIPGKNTVRLALESKVHGAVDNAGHLWLANDHGLLECYDDGDNHWVTREHTLFSGTSRNIMGVRRDPIGRLWIVYADTIIECDTIERRAGGVASLRKVMQLRPGRDFPRLFPLMFTVDSRDLLWMSLSTGVGVVDVSRHAPRFQTLLRYPEEIKDPSVRVIFRDRRGDVWMGGFTNGLDRLVGGDPGTRQMRHYSAADGLADNGVRSMAEDSNGVLWIGTRFGGVSLYDGAQFRTISMREGLPSNGVWSLAEGSNRRMWLGSEAGAVSVGIDPPHDVMLSSSSPRDGCTVLTSGNGRTLWVLFRKEVFVEESSTNVDRLPTPPIYVAGVTVNGEAIAALDSLELPYNQNNLVIQFIAPSFLDDRGIRYQYRLLESDRTWSAPARTRAVSYAALSPGSYRFEVRPVRYDGAAGDRSASVTFTVVPPFWQRWWFRGILALLFLGAGPLFYYRRVSRLQRDREIQHEFSRRLIESQEQERSRIAAELHDSLGQNLLVIQNYALLALDGAPGDAPVAGRLREISGVTKQTIDEVRKIAHNLRPYHLDKLGLTTSIGAIIRRISDASGIIIVSDIGPIDHLFDREAESHIYRIIQEALNNIAKHAGARQASVTVERLEESIRLRIQDDGRGFIAPTAPPAERSDGPRGFGLVGIAERVRIINGSFTISSTPGEGTVLTVDIPAKGARDA